MEHVERRPAHVLREGLFPDIVLLQRVRHDAHGRAGVVEDGGHQGAQAGRLGEGGGARGVSDRIR